MPELRHPELTRTARVEEFETLLRDFEHSVRAWTTADGPPPAIQRANAARATCKTLIADATWPELTAMANIAYETQKRQAKIIRECEAIYRRGNAGPNADNVFNMAHNAKWGADEMLAAIKERKGAIRATQRRRRR